MMNSEQRPITLHDQHGEIVETYFGPQHMYDVLMSRYNALKRKRDKELRAAYKRGYWIGFLATALTVFISFILTKLFG